VVRKRHTMGGYPDSLGTATLLYVHLQQEERMSSTSMFRISPARVAAFVLPLLAALAVTLSAHTAPAHAANGCGPADWRGRFVPDAPFTFNFRTACNTHDRCYATRWSRVAYSFWGAKQTCDRRFYGNMSNVCYRSYSGVSLIWRWCQYTAYGYYKAVDRWGNSTYRRAQGYA
jgi:hypothetical protein